jgi:hypothetical protein
MKEKKSKVTPKDFFLHLLAMVTLYASAISFTVIAFQVINIWVPDTIDRYASLDGARDAIRFAVSFLVVVFPVYLFTAWTLAKSYVSDKSKHKVWVRKWLVYLTLFVAALIIIGSLISLVFTFMNGEISFRFVLKLLSVLFVTGSIFGYYLWDEKRYERK